MNKYLIGALLAMQGASLSYACAQEVNDSLKERELQEVNVEGKRQLLKSGSMTFFPSAAQKNVSQSAVDLLKNMAIPQILVNPATQKVTTPSGEDINIYVNYLKASPEELQGMNMEDVRQVEFFPTASDPRFMGDRNVVNIIVRPYEYGGYTKASVSEWLIAGLVSDASVYSRFGYKKMSYDLYLGSFNTNYRHSGTRSEETCRLSPGEHVSDPVTRVMTPRSSQNIVNRFPLSARASYSGGNFNADNTIGFSYDSEPRVYSSGSLEFSPRMFSSSDYESNVASRKHALSYSGKFSLSLPSDFFISFTPDASYRRNRSDRVYSPSESSPIVTEASERAWSASAFIMGRKIIGGKHYLFLRAFGGYDNYRIDYSGNTSARDHIIERYAGGNFQYGYYTDRISASFLVGVRGEHDNTNGEVYKVFYPFAEASFGLSINRKNSLYLSVVHSKTPLEANHKSPNVFRSNEIFYYTGNPDIKPSPNLMAYLSYNWIPRSWLQLSPYVSYTGNYNREVPVYSLCSDGNAVLRKYVNNGNHHSASAGVSASFFLFNRSLQLSVNPSVRLYRSTGLYDISCKTFAYSANVSYYLKKFYFSGWLSLRSKALWTNSGTLFEDRTSFQISAGWSNSKLNARITVLNPFYGGWNVSTARFDTPLYSSRTTNYGITYHRNIRLSLTYTLGYGKRLNRNDELNGVSGSSSSAILR